MNLEPRLEIVLDKHQEMSAKQSLLAGISGIDASGKGFIAAKLADKIRRKRFILRPTRAAKIRRSYFSQRIKK